MKRYALVVRLGRTDSAKIQKSPMQAVRNVLFVDKQRLAFGLGDFLESLAAVGGAPSEKAIDIALIAAAVHAADTRISRHAGSQDGWSREIDLYLPTSDPALWNSVRSHVCGMLKFLTGDLWRISFRPRLPKFQTLAVEPQSGVGTDFSSVCLFSGGLDSFIGATDLLFHENHPLLVSHWSETLTRHYQTLCWTHLKKRFPYLSREVAAKVGFPRDLMNKGETEPTQRARSFLFFALAAVAADAVGCDTIHVPENGFIALNVPLDPLRLGALSTRTTHPYFIAQWNELLHKVGLNIHLVNPYEFLTKGEMLKKCKDEDFVRTNLGSTMSCSSPKKGRWKKQSPKHCGHCFPCLIRRAAIVAAFDADSTQYTIDDLAMKPLLSTKAQGENIRSLQFAISRFQRDPARSQFIIHEPGPLPADPLALTEYANMYKRAMSELSNLVAGVTTQPD